MRIESVTLSTLVAISDEDEGVEMIVRLNGRIEVHKTDGRIIEHFASPLVIRWMPDQGEPDDTIEAPPMRETRHG